MPCKSTFRHHRFPKEIILCAVRWYLRYPLSYQDVVDLLAERDVVVDRSTVYRWVQKFGPELTKRTEKHLRRARVDWHVDETYILVGGKWRYLWRAVDANGQMIDFRLTARRDVKAAKAVGVRDTFVALLHNERLLRVREFGYFHRLRSSPNLREIQRTTLATNGKKAGFRATIYR
ncbi:MAG: IS6 family transposase [Pseudomonadota bacterium]